MLENFPKVTYLLLSKRSDTPPSFHGLLLDFYYKTRSIRCLGSDFFDQLVRFSGAVPGKAGKAAKAAKAAALPRF